MFRGESGNTDFSELCALCMGSPGTFAVYPPPPYILRLLTPTVHESKGETIEREEGDQMVREEQEETINKTQ